MINVSFTKDKAPKCKNSFLLSADIVANKENITQAQRFLATTLGVSESRQFDALIFLLSHLRDDTNLYLGTIRELSQNSSVSRKSISLMIETLSSLNLIEVNTGYIEVSKELSKLFNQFNKQGAEVQLTLHFKTVPNQIELDL